MKALNEVQEVIAQRLGHVSRRLEEIHQAEEVRSSEHRKETWVLLFGLSIVLLFCFAAFFMNQIEVHDLHSDLQGDLERRSGETVDSIQKVVAELYGKNLPKLQSAIEKALKDKDQRDQTQLVKIHSELEAQGSRSAAQILESQRTIDQCLERMERLTKDLRDLQQLAKQAAPSSSGMPMPPAGSALGKEMKEMAAAPRPEAVKAIAAGHLLPEIVPAKVLPAEAPATAKP